MSNIKITQAAQDHFVKLLSEQEPETNIRVFVINPGTPSAECGVSYCPKNVQDFLLLFENFIIISENFTPLLLWCGVGGFRCNGFLRKV